jgi:hypothetical protein
LEIIALSCIISQCKACHKADRHSTYLLFSVEFKVWVSVSFHTPAPFLPIGYYDRFA